MSESKLQPIYETSYALIIGINEYQMASPLGYAVNDANSISNLLKKKFEFHDENVHLLVNDQATRSAILKRFLSFTSGNIDSNDRLIVFFAGHGHTLRSRKGEVGFLVPYDGNVNDLSSLIRWDDLTRNADLIPAKHILFVMDACYGGLAITRTLQPGSMRFLQNMLLRPARQVLTAGKADEVVADLGGPIPEHSIFTGHFIEALSGKASDSDGIITANGVMAYVYQNVGRDPDSHQTPHFGYLDGDGDLIFSAPILTEFKDDEIEDEDVLVTIPSVLQEGNNKEMTLIDQVKEYLSDERHKIKLHDLVSIEIREALSLTAEDYFPGKGSWTEKEFAESLEKYEQVMKNLYSIEALIAYWGSETHRETLTLPIKHIAGRSKIHSGLNACIKLQSYPMLLLLYSGGISAVAKNNYNNLQALMNVPVIDPDYNHKSRTLVRALFYEMSEISDAFKSLPGHERDYVPISEYLYKLFQPILDDLLFLGTDYETYFDKFEVLLALEHAEQYKTELNRLWSPSGRFGWKYKRDAQLNPFSQIISEAKLQRDSWPPIKAGLFHSSIERFVEIADEYVELLQILNWY